MAAKINVSNTNFTEVEADVLIILINEEDASKAQLRRHERYADHDRDVNRVIYDCDDGIPTWLPLLSIDD